MGMFGLKLRTNIPCADVIKILRQFDPDASISNLRFKIIHNDFVQQKLILVQEKFL